MHYSVSSTYSTRKLDSFLTSTFCFLSSTSSSGEAEELSFTTKFLVVPIFKKTTQYTIKLQSALQYAIYLQ